MVSVGFTELLNGVTIGFVYVLLAAGLSVIFGVMNVINFAHGELFALGAYFAVAVIGFVGAGAPGFAAALVVAPLLVGVVGVALERYTIRPLYGRNPLYHILLTFGLVLMLNEAIQWRWGRGRHNLRLPETLNAPIEILGFSYAAFNYFMIAFAAALSLGIWGLLNYTRFGLVVRAGAQDREMVRNLGIDIDRYYSLVFGLGAALAGVAGIILGGYQTVGPEIGTNIIIPAFVIVVLGGLGSFRGAVVAGLLVGIIQETLRVNVPQLEGLVVFLLMIGILLVRPQGLFGSEAPEDEGGGELLAGSAGSVLEARTRRRLGALAVVLLALVPLGAGTLYSAFWVTIAIQALAWALFALSLDFVMGYTGLVSLGHALFYGAGAYTGVLVLLNVTESAFVALGAAVVVAAALAWVVGYLSIRVHGVYFAMITLGFAELFHNFVTKLEITNKDIGLFGADSYYGFAGVGVGLDEIAVGVGPVALTGKSLYYYVVLVALIGSYLLTRRMIEAPFGSVLVAIRENEQRATFLGYDVTTYKRRAFVVSGALAGLAGGLFAMADGFVDPGFAHWLRSGEVIVMVILGGMGTLVGPIVGAGAYYGLEHFLEGYTEHWRFFLGLLFVIFVIFFPRGLISMPARIAPHLPESVAGPLGLNRTADGPPPLDDEVEGGDR